MPKRAKRVYDNGEPREVDAGEKAFVDTLFAQIDRAERLTKDFFTRDLPRLRKEVYGAPTNGKPSDAQKARTNLVYGTLAAMLPHIYARNPDIAVTPTEAVGDNEYDVIKKFGRTAEIMLRRAFIEDAEMKSIAKDIVRSAMTTRVGWSKLVFQESLVGDPLLVARAADIQDNIRRIEYLATKEDGEGVDAAEERREALKQELEGIRSNSEVKLFKGFAVDAVRTEHMLILDESVQQFTGYKRARRLAQILWYTDEDYKEVFGAKPGAKATAYSSPKDDSEGHGDDQSICWRKVYEVWDTRANRVYTLCRGEEGYIRPPYSPRNTPRRWHGFFCLGFNIVEGRWWPLSDVELISKLCEEYNQTRHLYAETRKEAIPVRVFRKTGELTEEDIKALTDRKARQFIGIGGNPSVPLNQDILQLDGLTIDPAAFDVTLIRNDMDMVVGLSDASRANLIEAKTATEAEILKQNLQSRMAERQDAIEDMIGEMAEAALQQMLRIYSEVEVKSICGEDAVWPQLDVDAIFHKVRVSVKAGTTGKPNVQKEREQWAQLMPVINDTITQVMELRMNGQFDLADAKIELLKETLTRYDERIDVERFIPRQEMGADGKPIQQAQQQQQLMQAAQQAQALGEELQKTKEELQACQQALQKAQLQEASAVEAERSRQAEAAQKAAEAQRAAAEEESKRVIAAAQESSKAEQKRSEDAARVAETEIKAREEAAAKAGVERDKMMREERLARMKIAADLIAKLGVQAAQIAAQRVDPSGELVDEVETMGAGLPADMRELPKKAAQQKAEAAHEAAESKAVEKAEPKSGDAAEKKSVKISGDKGDFKGDITKSGGKKTLKIVGPGGKTYTAEIESS